MNILILFRNIYIQFQKLIYFIKLSEYTSKIKNNIYINIFLVNILNIKHFYDIKYVIWCNAMF